MGRALNQRLRRPALLLLAAVLAVLTLLGGRVWSARPDPVTVNVLMAAPFADATAGLVDRFNRSHDDLRIRVTRGPMETESVSDLAISSLLLGNSPYDLLLMDVTWTAKYAAAGWLTPLDPLLGEDPLAGVVAGARLGNRIDDQLWRVPLLASMGLLYWRTDLMDQPPRTPAELVAISRQLQRDGRVPWGYLWQGRQYEGLSCVFLEVLQGFGGWWWEPGASPSLGLNQAPSIRAAAWLGSLIDEGVSPRAVANFAEPQVLQSFENGQAAFMRNWPYAWSELQKQGSAVAGKVGVTTMVAEPGERPAATQGSWGLSVVSQSEHPREAAAVLRYLTGADSQKTLAIDWGYTPTLRSVFTDPEVIAANPVMPELQRALDDAVLRPVTPLYAQFSDILQRQLSSVLTGSIDAERAMGRAGGATERLLDAAGAGSR
ncbi:ABC transporter substrate-binding protein [Synechococcus sp. RSCCF101]|uniref:ABC transporter substrate-binding protein n=1 Tax=Synechococcus sp. RSCCF101 TaxID=2511069 RepID=UPI001248507C|nr:ABC transporter substrate-binding protein [Synechococcus sp. RSCCF101]QEY31690.1 ABC transporter substrate-binding protein [Synechococcus sp. RSCCF101]